MSLTQTDICNQALVRIGSKRISSINDDTKAANLCLEVWASTVGEVSRCGQWNCLLKRAELGRLTEAPAFEWDYQYQLPADFVSMVQLNGIIYHGQPQDDWEIEGRRLLTDAETAQVRYVALVEDVSQWDALFADAVVVLMASKMAVAIRQDESMASNLRNEYERITLSRARQRDGNEKKRVRYSPTSESTFIAARCHSTNEG